MSDRQLAWLEDPVTVDVDKAAVGFLNVAPHMRVRKPYPARDSVY